jgi:glutamate synthase domain-containing protein 1
MAKEVIRYICGGTFFWYKIFYFFMPPQILRDAQTLSQRMNHRGACACDNDTGDGAGVLAAIPHDLYAEEL